jgi:hypothetical protein
MSNGEGPVNRASGIVATANAAALQTLRCTDWHDGLEGAT